MISFENDYSEGASEKILQRLIETNMEQLSGYGNDRYCESAKEKIRKACGCPEAEIYFLSGGTQTNRIVISSMLQPYEGVIAAQTGHVSSHEAGAIESSGHKVLTLPQHDGKIEPEELADYLNDFYGDGNHEHMVFPGMVYISHPTEYGTLYTKGELAELADICLEYHIPLYLDGARLGYALAADTDVTLKDVADYCDVFYIGGTKVGALCGEAVVFTKENVPAHFLTRIKQQGGLLAKGRLLGIQFLTLFEENRYFDISAHAARLAEKLKDELIKMGVKFYIDSPTNQQFPILPDAVLAELKKKYSFAYQERMDETHSAVRFCTCWATKEENVDMLLADIQKLLAR